MYVGTYLKTIEQHGVHICMYMIVQQIGDLLIITTILHDVKGLLTSLEPLH